MASPFERAFNPAFQQASAAAMKSLDDERQENRFQQRMLEQRQYDAKQLEGSRAYAANLLKDSNKIDQDRIDAATKLAAQRTEQANFPINYRLAIEAGVPASELKEMTWENNAAIIAMTGRETHGRKEGEQRASTGALPTLTDLFGETPDARGVLKKFDAMNAERKVADANTEAAAKQRAAISAEQAARTLTEKRAEYRAKTGMVADPEDDVAWLDKKIADYEENRVEGKDYKRILDEYETETGKSGSGMPLGQLSFGMEQARYDKSLKRNLYKTDEESKINMRAASNVYLGNRLQHLNAEERDRVLGIGDDPNKQAEFLRNEIEEVVTYFAPTISKPSGGYVTTYRLRLKPSPEAKAKAGAGAGAGVEVGAGAGVEVEARAGVEEGSSSDIFDKAMRKIKANSIKRDVTPAPGAGDKLPNPSNYPFRPAPGAGYYRLPPHFPVRPSGLNSTRDSGVTNRLVPLTLDPRLNAQ